MEADALVSTLRELKAEKSSDVLLFQALARRFRANADEFFPPQVDSVVDFFAGLRYADDRLLEGFAGRLGDLASDASPRRVVRLLKNGATLQFPPEAWLVALLPQLHRQLPNLRDGVPTVLAGLHALRWRDDELVELLLTQGLIMADEYDGGWFTRLFERWSRHGRPHAEVEDRATSLAAGDAAMQLDLRDRFNLLAGLYRCGGSAASKARSRLEEQLVAQLSGSSPGGGGSAVALARAPTAAEEAATALEWMRRLTLRSPRLWRACADSMEVALRDPAFVRDHLPAAVHALAALIGSGGERDEELSLVAALLNAPQTRDAMPRYSAPQVLQLLLAACLLRVPPKGGSEGAKAELPCEALLRQAARMARQLSLPGRRALREAAESLRDLPSAADAGGELSEPLEAVRALPMSTLPPLVGAAEEAEWPAADVGARALLVPPTSRRPRAVAGARRGVHLLGFGDTFIVPAGTDKAGSAPTTPSCRLAVRAMELQGWQVELRA